MKIAVVWISLGLWLIYDIIFIYKEILRNDSKKSNFFHLIRFDSILFLAIYLFYKHWAKNVYFPYLFLAIVITNIVYLIYDLEDNYTKKRLNIKEIIYYILFIIIASVLFIIYIIYKDYLSISTYCLLINIFIPSYVWFVNHIIINNNDNRHIV